MAIDPNIIGQLQPVATPDALSAFARLQAVKNAQVQNQALSQDVQAQSAQLDEVAAAKKDQEILRAAWVESGGDYDKLPLLVLKAGGRPKLAMQLDEERIKRAKERAEIDQKGLERKKYQNDQFLGLIKGAEELPDEEYAAQYPAIAAKAKALNPDLQIPDEPIPKEKLGFLRIHVETESGKLKREEEKRKAAEAKEKSVLDRIKVRRDVAKDAATLMQDRIEEEGRNNRAKASDQLRRDLAKTSGGGGGSSIPSGKVTESAKRWADRIEAGDAKVENVPLKERGGVLKALEGRDINRKISEGAINKLAEFKSAIASLQDLRKTLLENEQFIGPIAGFQAYNPYSEARKAQAKIDLVRQRVGKALEGGVLRKEDEEKYKKILATLRDEPSTAIAKVDGIIATLERDMEIFRAEQQAAGRVTKSNPKPASGGEDLKKLSTDELFRRLQQ